MDEASKLINDLPSQVASYRVNYYTYGCSERDMAIILQTMCLMNGKQQAIQTP